MTNVDTKALELLGKEISFQVILPDQLKLTFPDGLFVNGVVESVVINLSGNHEILVKDNFYSLDEIQIK